MTFKRGEPQGWARASRGKGKAMAWVQAHVQHQGSECLIWPFSAGDGYPHLGHNGKSYRAHRLMCRLAHGEPPTTKYQAAHACGNSRCINPKHLSWKTNGDNQLDRRRHGTTNTATWGRRGKLPAETVRKIRSLKGTMSHAKIAEAVGAKKGNVGRVLRGDTWRGVGVE